MNALNGEIIFHFNYDDEGFISSIEERTGEETSLMTILERQDDQINIHSPHGQVAGLGLDEDNRITTLTNNADDTARFTYNEHGNLTQILDSIGRNTNFTYDSLGNILTQTNANGDLLTKVFPQGETCYTYDTLGNLISVRHCEEQCDEAIPAGDTRIDYIIDGNNRRVGKKINNVLVFAWLYKDALNPIAELNPDGSLRSSFIYGTKVNVPDYMIRDGVTYRIVSDHLGSPSFLIKDFLILLPKTSGDFCYLRVKSKT